MEATRNSPIHVSPKQFPVDWTNVRAVYKKLQDDFHLITTPFGIKVPTDRNRDLAHLICAIDVVDRELDELENAEDRNEFISAVLAYLRSETIELWVSSNRELIHRMACLREIINRLEIAAPFCDTVEEIVRHGEAKRVAKTEEKMIHHLVEEWRLTGRLPILFLREYSNPRFEDFFFKCCASMPAIDMLQDAWSDYRNGQINVRPTIRLYLGLAWMFLKSLPGLVWRFPKPVTLFRYACSFIWQALRLGTDKIENTAKSTSF